MIAVNILIKGYIINKQATAAVQFAESLQKNERNVVTFLLWANAIAQIGNMKLADKIHFELKSLSTSMQDFFANDRKLTNALIDVTNQICSFDR